MEMWCAEVGVQIGDDQSVIASTVRIPMREKRKSFGGFF
jgi:hypothetical protein